MGSRSFVVLVLALALSLCVLAAAEAAPGSSAIFLRGNVGYDPLGGGFAFGAGGGYRLPFGADNVELLADAYYGPVSDKWTEGSYSNVYNAALIIIAVRANWLFFYTPGRSGFFAILGTGLFAGNYSWTQEQTYLYSPYTVYNYSDSYFASGTVFNLGGAFAFSFGLELRAEIPVMVFFGQYGRAAAVSIPVTLSVGYLL